MEDPKAAEAARAARRNRAVEEWERVHMEWVALRECKMAWEGCFRQLAHATRRVRLAGGSLPPGGIVKVMAAMTVARVSRPESAVMASAFALQEELLEQLLLKRRESGLTADEYAVEEVLVRCELQRVEEFLGGSQADLAWHREASQERAALMARLADVHEERDRIARRLG